MKKNRNGLLTSVLLAVLSVIVVAPATQVGATTQPSSNGLCGGESTPLLHLRANATGRHSREIPKVIIGLSSDVVGSVRGNLIFERGKYRLQVLQWCRLWVGNKTRDNSDTVHAVGIFTNPNGSISLLRADVRYYPTTALRLRTRPLQHEDHMGVLNASNEEDEEHAGWASVVDQKWIPLTHVRVQLGKQLGIWGTK